MSISPDPACNLQQRKIRTAAVLAQFQAKPFSWKGRANCIHLARAQMVAFGHTPPPVPHFSTAIGARWALHKRGFDTLTGLLDSMLPQIPPASAWLGDLILLAGEPFDALTLCAAGGFVMGWHDADLSRMQSIKISTREVIAAWRL